MSNSAEYIEAMEMLKWFMQEFMEQYGWTQDQITNYMRTYGFPAVHRHIQKKRFSSGSHHEPDRRVLSVEEQLMAATITQNNMANIKARAKYWGISETRALANAIRLRAAKMKSGVDIH